RVALLDFCKPEILPAPWKAQYSSNISPSWSRLASKPLGLATQRPVAPASSTDRWKHEFVPSEQNRPSLPLPELDLAPGETCPTCPTVRTSQLALNTRPYLPQTVFLGNSSHNLG